LSIGQSLPLSTGFYRFLPLFDQQITAIVLQGQLSSKDLRVMSSLGAFLKPTENKRILKNFNGLKRKIVTGYFWSFGVVLDHYGNILVR
jgi:hypothetical protein